MEKNDSCDTWTSSLGFDVRFAVHASLPVRTFSTEGHHGVGWRVWAPPVPWTARWRRPCLRLEGWRTKCGAVETPTSITKGWRNGKKARKCQARRKQPCVDEARVERWITLGVEPCNGPSRMHPTKTKRTMEWP